VAGDFGSYLRDGGVVLFDGAMGTMLYARGVFLNRAFEELNLTEPQVVRSIHEEYRAAGAQVIETNTFTANRYKLSAHGLAAQVEAINARGAELAREAAAGEAWVAGSIGPLGVRIEPFGPVGRDEAREVFREQAQALAGAGVDLFSVETFGHLPELEEALRAVREVSALPVVAQVSVATGGVTREGVAAAEAAERMVRAGADAVGVNCSEALAILEALEEMRGAVDVPLIAQPNAGTPRTVQGRNLYLASPEYLVAWGRRALRSGVTLLGGCCGTTPDHIRALRPVVRETAPRTPAHAVARRRDRPPAAAPVARAEKSRLARALAAGTFVTGVQLPLPTGWDAGPVLADARRVAEAGIGFCALPEVARGGAQLPPLAAAQQCALEGVETLVTYSCRGRRLPRIQTDLLGACAAGVTNLLLVTGEPIEADVYAEPDLDVDSIGAVNLAARLNHGEDLGGNPIGAPTRFHVAVRLDPAAPDQERELSRFHWKVDAGAEFAVTSPVFDPGQLAVLLDRLGADRVPVIATLWPLRTAREAEFFEQQMANVPVPAPLIARMQEAEAQGAAAAEGLAIARELADAVRPLVSGLLVVAPAEPETALAVFPFPGWPG